MLARIRFFILELILPKRLVLSQDQAETVEHFFMGGSTPEGIARAMFSTYGKTEWKYFRLPNADRSGFDFGPIDYEVDGLEFLRSAMVKLGAIKVRKDKSGKVFDFYQPEHRMVKKLAGIMVNAGLPKSRQEA